MPSRTPVAAGGLELGSGPLRVTMQPGNGCDITSIVDTATGVDVLWRTPWAGAAPHAAAWDSQSRWLAAYQGGWQVLCPNAGAERTVAGAARGFHGEAAVVPWTVLDQAADAVTCEVDLFTAPFRLRRTVQVDGRTVTITERVQNLSPDPHELVWMHHPGFGAPLLGTDARIDLPGGVVVADAAAPGTVLAAASRHEWPGAAGPDGSTVDLRAVPGPDESREVFAHVAEMPDGWFALSNPAVGVGVAMRWDVEVFPFMWWWQEMHATAEFPWFRRAYVMGLEPSMVPPWTGSPDEPQASAGPDLAGGAELETELQLTVYTPAPGRRVVAVPPGGTVVEEDA